MDNNNVNRPLRWYQRWTGIMGVGLVLVILLMVIIFSAVVGYYVWQIRQGKGEILFNKVYSGFSTTSTQFNVQEGKIDKSELEIADAPYLGSNNPKVTVVEFVDFKCPNCKLASPIMRQVLQKYGNKVKLIIRNFPVESTHAGSNQLAIISMCAYDQGYYWPMHDWLYLQQELLDNNFSDEELKNLAINFGWDAQKMFTCVNDPASRVRINKDYADGYRFGVAGTPTFFINGEKVEGVIPFSVWELYLNNVK